MANVSERKAGERVKLNPTVFTHLSKSRLNTHGRISMIIAPFWYSVQWDDNTHGCFSSDWLLSE